jgi:hypothetical protein
MSKYLDKYLKYKHKYKQLQMIGGMVQSATHYYYGPIKEDLINDEEINQDTIIRKFLEGISNSVDIPESITHESVYDFIIEHAEVYKVFSCQEDCPFNIIFGIEYKILHYFFICNEDNSITLYLVKDDHTWSYIEIMNNALKLIDLSYYNAFTLNNGKLELKPGLTDKQQSYAIAIMNIYYQIIKIYNQIDENIDQMMNSNDSILTDILHDILLCQTLIIDDKHYNIKDDEEENFKDNEEELRKIHHLYGLYIDAIRLIYYIINNLEIKVKEDYKYILQLYITVFNSFLTNMTFYFEKKNIIDESDLKKLRIKDVINIFTIK